MNKQERELIAKLTDYADLMAHEIYRQSGNTDYQKAITSDVAEARLLNNSDGWIKCAERMPEKCKWVLGYSVEDTFFIQTVYWKDGTWFETVNFENVADLITHWRELPEPPK